MYVFCKCTYIYKLILLYCFLLYLVYNTSCFYWLCYLFTAASIIEQSNEVTANASHTIRCDVFGGDRVIWRKNDKKIKLDNRQIYAGGNVIDPSLKIKKISHLDRGNYTCETTYRGITARSITIHLHVKGNYKIIILTSLLA